MTGDVVLQEAATDQPADVGAASRRRQLLIAWWGEYA
jgi:hypothetical protein